MRLEGALDKWNSLEDRGHWEWRLPGERQDLKISLNLNNECSWSLDLRNLSQGQSIFKADLVVVGSAIVGIKDNSFIARAEIDDEIYYLK